MLISLTRRLIFVPGPDGKKRYRMSGPELEPQILFDILMSYLLDLSSKVNASAVNKGLAFVTIARLYSCRVGSSWSIHSDSSHGIGQDT